MGGGAGIVGTVSAISGNTVTVTESPARKEKENTAAKTYSVDATNAKIEKSGVAATISSLAVGDRVMVQGTVSGTNVVATNIRDGRGPGMGQGWGMGGKGGASATSTIVGNGNPIVAGNVTAVNGNTLTITNKSNATFTIDVTNAKIEKSGAVSSVSNVAVGDGVIVQGTVNGNSVVASSVIDRGAAPAANTTGNTATPAHAGFWGGMAGFFGRIFGF